MTTDEVTITEAADLLDRSRSSVKRYIQKGKLSARKGMRKGRTINFIPREDVESMLEDRDRVKADLSNSDQPDSHQSTDLAQPGSDEPVDVVQRPAHDGSGLTALATTLTEILDRSEAAREAVGEARALRDERDRLLEDLSDARAEIQQLRADLRRARTRIRELERVPGARVGASILSLVGR